MTQKSKSVLLIIPYFGKFNNYFPFFLESCRNNPTINWLIVTDDKTNYDYPYNVKVCYKTFNELKDKIQSLFNFPIALGKPYKLCDFRVAYGEIFSEDIKDFDFWGYCDTDLIFGDIRKFLTDEVLQDKQKVLSRGHLSLYRNNDRMNSFYRNETGGFYKTVFSTERGFSFDEWSGTTGIANYLKNNLSAAEFWDGLPFDDLSTLKGNFIPSQKKEDDCQHIIYKYDSGVLSKLFMSHGDHETIKEEPILYAHFQKRPLSVRTENVRKFIICPNQLIEFQAITPPDLRRLARGPLIYTQYFKIRYNNLIRKLKNLIKNINKKSR